MKIHVILFSIIIFTISIDSHPSLEDRPIKLFFHCGKNAITKMNAEGRGGMGALLSWVESEKQNHEKKDGRAYLLFPFLKSDDKNLKTFPYDGYQSDKGNVLEIGLVKLGLGFLNDKTKEDFDPNDLDALVYFVKTHEEKLNPSIPQTFPDASNLPIFLLAEPGKEASFVYIGNVHQIHCPTDFGKLGVLDLYFRKRNLIRMHHDVLSINLQDRNRSWKRKHPSVEEEVLPANSQSTKDKSPQVYNLGNPYGGLGNSFDREILGTEKSFDINAVQAKP